MSRKQIGTIEIIPYEIKQIEWKIPDYFSVLENLAVTMLVSPTFYVADIPWNLNLFPKGWYKPDYTELLLKNDWDLKCSIEYYCGFKKCDGTLEELVSRTLKSDEFSLERNVCSVKRKKLFQRKSELVPSDVLTITYTLKIIIESMDSTQHFLSDQTKALTLINLDKLSDNFKDLFDDKESCDVTLKVKNKEYKAHKSVLIARSRVFAANFKHDTLEKQTGIITISDCESDSFEEFLKYLYSGKVEVVSFRRAQTLYYTSDKYDVQEVKVFCIDYLKQCLSVENICEVVNFADTYDERALFSAAQDFFNKNVNNILVTSDWESFMKMNPRLANKLFIAMPKVKYEE